ncbi:MAG: amino acid adenylation domain-containing protein [Thainema sp.]
MQTTQSPSPSAIEGYRLSPQQQRIWKLQSIHPDQPFRVSAQIRYHGALEAEQLQIALQQLINRHEILRTTFRTLPGMTVPLQVIAPTLDPATVLTTHDWRDVSVTDLASKIAHCLEQPFNWVQGPLLQVHWLQRQPSDDILLISLPALCADAATLPLLIQELQQLYNSNTAAPASEPLQYADLAEWQADLLESEETAAGRSYWRRTSHLDDCIQSLPLEHSSPQTTFRPCTHSLSLPADQVQRIQSWAAQQDVTVADVCLATWQIVMGRLSGQTAITLGYTCDERQQYEELQTAAGLLTRDLPLWIKLPSEQTFLDIVQQTRAAVQDIQPWQDYFAWEQIQPQSTGGFPVSFGFESVSGSAIATPFQLERILACLEPFTLRLVCRHNADHASDQDSLTADFYYDANRLSAAAVEQIQGHWLTLLLAAIAQPNTPIAQLPLLTAAERQRLLIDFNANSTDPLPYASWHQWFEDQVKQTPDQPAARFEDQQLTYRELNARANQLAHYLRQTGVKPESIVAIVLPRSLDWLIAVLGVLKSGGAYLPLDPHQPVERLNHLCQSAGAVTVLTNAEICDRIFNHISGSMPVVALDRDWPTIASSSVEHSAENPENPTQSSHLVYVMYTSGSTGQPKGVAVEHRQLLNYVQGIIPQLQLSSAAHYGMVSSVAADLGHTMLFPALCTGGCLHLLSEDRVLQAEALADYCRQYPLDSLKIVPSHLAALLSESESADWLPRQCLVLGGEAVPSSLVATVRRQATHCRILNHYGPTETTVGVLTHVITDGLEPGEASDLDEVTVPLGRPLPNVQVYVLDAALQPLPIGVPGELYIGGASVSRGYWQQPDLTAERFIANPFGQGLLYKTGDRVRHLSNGTLEFLGRTDDQIKLRGYRIELGEITAVLQQHPAVQQAITLLRTDSPEISRLVAYVVPARQSNTSPGTFTNRSTDELDLRHYLAEKLPDYMVPTAIVQLRAFPLTANGKIDRQALPVPPTQRAEQAVAPRTPAEQILTEIWQQLLGVDAVGIHDNFFELGGDSILSIQAIAKANQAGLQLTPRQLFEHQTIAALAAVAGTEAVSVAEQGQVTGTLPLTPIQHRFFEQVIPNRHHWNQAVLLATRTPIEPTVLEQALQHLLQHHDALRLRFQQHDQGWQAIHRDDATVQLTVVDGRSLSQPEYQEQIAFWAEKLQTSMNLATGPLVQAAWFDWGSQRSGRLLLVVHHLVIDGVSWRILLDDLQTVYHQLQQRQSVELPAKTTAFKQWAEQLTVYAQSPELQAKQTEWQFVQEAEAALPVDDPAGQNAIATAQTVSVQLDAAATKALLQDVPQAYQTQINDVLLTALMQAIAPWIGRSSLLLELEGHGREDVGGQLDLSRTVGWFTAIFPVQLTLPTGNAAGAALMAIKEQLRHSGRGIDYGVLRYLSSNHSARQDGQAEVRSQFQQHPQPQLIFNYLGQFDSSLPETGLFDIAPESHGVSRDPQAERRHLIEINGRILAGQLQLDWTYSSQCHQRQTIERLAHSTLNKLRSLIEHCTAADAGGYTPSDFPQAQLSQTDLEQVLAQLAQTEEA